MNTMQPEIQWFIARDGKQHGPISDVEMTKLAELGHLRPHDLVWRQGFADWRPATAVFPPPGSNSGLAPSPAPQSAAMAPAAPTAPAAANPRPMGDAPRTRAFDVSPPPRARMRGTGLLLGLILVLGGFGTLAFLYKDTLKQQLSALTESKTATAKVTPSDATPAPANTELTAEQAAAAPPPQPAAAQPLPGLEGPSAALDSQLSQFPHWAVIRREFPEWYVERMTAAAKLTAENAKEGEVGRYLAAEIVRLRRQNMQQALSAPVDRLRNVATTFLANLAALEKISPDVCYAFIARGENTPIVAEILNTKDLRAPVKEQVAAIFEAVSDGRKSPVKHASAQKPDYDLLASHLSKNGWSTEQLQLFANPTALAESSPDRVCKMVQDWFRAHLAIEDAQVQERLLFETLKPVFGG